MAMSELGAFLQRHREERGWTLAEVEAQTRIRHKYVQAIEAGDWDVLPPSVYTRGLLRHYARVLGVSEASVLRMYVKERPGEARLPEPQLISQPLINEPRFSAEMLVTGAVFLLAAVLFGWLTVTQLLPLLVPKAAVKPTPATAKTAVAGVVNGTPVATARPSVAAGTAPPRSTVAPLATETPAATPTPMDGVGLLVKNVSQRPEVKVWLRIVADDQKVFEGFLSQNEARTWNAKGKMRVRTGNAGDTQLTLNAKQLDPIGKPGEIRDLEWQLSPDGSLVQRDVQLRQ